MRAAALAALSSLTLVAAPAAAQGVAFPPAPPAVVAIGRGEIRVTPDRATVMVAVETRGRTAAIAGAENARITRVTLDALRAQGLAADQLSTADYSVHPEQNWDERTRKPLITGYVARNTVRAEVRKMDQVGNVVDAALAGGANMIQGINFWSSNTDQARRSALQKAVENACLDAAAMARGAGRVLGAPLEISSSFDMPYPPPRPMMMARGAAADAAGVPTQIEAGEQTLMVTVTARWSFAASAASPDVPACAR